MLIPKSLQNLINEFEKLPTIGPKSASRLAFSLITSGGSESLAKAISEANESLQKCEICSNISEENLCEICKSDVRNKNKICVVEDSLDVMAIERMNKYDGVFHVLEGLISPMEDVGSIKLNELINRVEKSLQEGDNVEVIVAINHSIEGELTLMYIKDLLSKLENNEKVNITRLASGLPTGADIEYADQMTLAHAFDARLKI